jgi:hypothetical protein
LTVIYTAQSEAPQTKTRGTFFPLLVALFVVSYGILTLVVVEQGRTIESQRSLLREMLNDSTQLAALKGKLARDAQSKDKPAAQPEPKAGVSGGAGNAAPKAPSKEAKRPGKSARTMKAVPEKPAADLRDVRRSTRAI